MMKMKKALALTLSATMAMGIAMPVMAADPTVTAPIYSFEVLQVVVPTDYQVAFNPEGLTVKTGASTTSTDQILSRSYGMINKGNKDQVMTVSLQVEDQNTGDDKVTFVDSADEVTNAKAGEYKIHLTAIAADTTEVQVGSTPTSATDSTTASDLNSVTMTKADEATAVTLKGGENKIAFKLDKAVYSPKSGSELELGASGSSTNDVASNFEITSLAASGKGITAFTFGGSMNNVDTNWSKLTAGIKITATYSNEIAPSSATAIAGTGAMVKMGPQISMNNDGLITMTNFTADQNYVSLAVTDGEGTKWDIGDSPYTWDLENYDAETGGDANIQLSEGWISFLIDKGGDVELELTLSDGSTRTFSITIS